VAEVDGEVAGLIATHVVPRRADAHGFYERSGFERRAQAFIKRLG
jgi:hypothetical protein